MGEFKREVRYAVVKLKNISSDQRCRLADFLQSIGVETTECAVVESDWPESAIVWQMIQDRVEGRPNQIERLTKQLDRLLDTLGIARAEIERINGSAYVADIIDTAIAEAT